MFSRLNSPTLSLCLAAGLVCCLAGPALAQATKPDHKPTPEPSPYKTPTTRDKNAALEYMTIRDLFDTKFLQLVGEKYNGEAGWVPDEQLTVLLEENQPVIRRLMEASRLPNCDFGIRYEEGFSALLPHLGHMRQFARVLGADGRRLAVAGRTGEAAERYVTCLRIAAHATNDRILLSSLVSMAICSLAMNQSEITTRDFGLSDAARRDIIKAARALLTDDPFATRACLQTEKQLALASIKPWIKDQGEHAGRVLVKQLREWRLDNEALKAVEPLNEQQINEHLDLLVRYYAALDNAWVAKDAPDRLKHLEERLEAGEFGLLVKHLAPALTKALQSTRKTTKEIQDVTALLEAVHAAEPEPTGDDSAAE